MLKLVVILGQSAFNKQLQLALFHEGICILHAQFYFLELLQSLSWVFLLQCFLCFMIPNLPIWKFEYLWSEISHTVLAIKKLEIKGWNGWKMVEMVLAFFYLFVFLPWVVLPCGLILLSLLVALGAGGNFEMWSLWILFISLLLLLILLPLRSFFVVFIHPQLQLGDKSRMEGSPSESHGIF